MSLCRFRRVADNDGNKKRKGLETKFLSTVTNLANNYTLGLQITPFCFLLRVITSAFLT